MSAHPKGRIVPLHDDVAIRLCARMMADTDPWRALHFSVEQCESALRELDIEVHGWVDGSGDVAGFIATAAHGVGPEPLIEFVCVDGKRRDTGIGSKLITFAEDVLFPAADNIYLFVSDINPAAQRLYERLGYVKVGALPNFNLEGQTEFFYRKTRRPRQARYTGEPA